MSIEAIATVATEVLKTKAVEAAQQQLIQKLSAGSMEQSSISPALEQSSISQEVEKPCMQDGFRVGEISSPDIENKDILKQKEFDAANELALKMEQPNQTSSIEQVNEKIKYEIHTRNESLEGDRHPITGVPFERKTVVDSEGNDVTGVFPIFDSKFDVTLPEEKLQASDAEQFSECNKQLRDTIKDNPEIAKQFNKDQLEQIENGDTPDGFVWHHNEDKGKMQLVDSEIHAKTGHTGGKSIWGGGTENR